MGCQRVGYALHSLQPESTKDRSLLSTRFIVPIAAVLCLLLQACTSATPGATAADAVTDPESVPELTLNLPDHSKVACERDQGVDYTFLDKGFSALVSGDHIEAVTYFQRYQRTESAPLADWEADVAIAYDSMLPQSPFYDPTAARKSYLRLKELQPEGAVFHEKTLMMLDALATFAAMQGQLQELQQDKAALAEDLEKREAALRRLRELTLGQKAAAP